MLRIDGGWLSVGGKKLVPMPADAWMHIEIEAGVGESANGTWTLIVTPPGGAEQTIGNGFAFRSEQSGVTALANWAVKVNNVGTSLTDRICNFWVHP